MKKQTIFKKKAQNKSRKYPYLKSYARIVRIDRKIYHFLCYEHERRKKMSTFKINKNRDFTVMSNYHLRDKNLSLKAKGLLSFMLSLPEDWDYSLKGLIAICKENRDAIQSALNELKNLKYLEINRLRDSSGRYEYEYIIYEIPLKNRIKTRDSPHTDFPYTDNPTPENQHQINTKKQNDKTDKPNHNILTLELIKIGFIDENDFSSFSFDNLFTNYLQNGYSYRDLFSAIHYIAPKVIEREFLDEYGEKIENKYGYFKTSIESNFRKLENLSKELYNFPDDDFERS